MELDYSLKFDDNQIEYSIIPYADLATGEAQVDQLLQKNRQEIEEITKKMEDLKIDADTWDYSIAALSGVLAGIIDILYVGELSFKSIKECHEIGSEKTNDFVKKIAKTFGFKEKPELSDEDNLKRAIDHLEKISPFAADQKNIMNSFGGTNYHHFRDFSHHPTLIGWIFSMVTQYTGLVFGANAGGVLVAIPVEDESRIGKDHFEKILFGTVTWLIHMVSDVAGSSGTPGAGTGLPGPLLSLAKEVDSVRAKLFNSDAKIGDDADAITGYLSKLFNGTAFVERDGDGKIIRESVVRFDYRTEIGMLENVKVASKMFVPVLINECIVRSFFFIKRFVVAVKEANIHSLSDLKTLEWKRILPFNNATLTRMLTISVGAMEIVDISDAAIHGAIEAYKSGQAGAAAGSVGGPYGAAAGAATSSTVAFWKTFALRVNYVGVGRLVICFGSEFSFEHKRQKALSERIAAYDEALRLMNAKLLFREADMWISAQKAGESIEEAYQLMGITEEIMSDSLDSISENMMKIGDHINSADEKNPGLKDDMLNTLKWGI